MSPEILKFARLVEKDLGLDATNISNQPINCFGAYFPDEDVVLIDLRYFSRIQPNDVRMVVAHELRHRWQYKNGWVFNHKLPYSLRKHEIDAREYSIEFVRNYLKEKLYV